MITKRLRILVLVVALSFPTIPVSSLPISNRGKQLFLALESSAGVFLVTALDEPRKWILQSWHRDLGFYHFVLAVTRPTADGSQVSFTRYAMGADYFPREEHKTLSFPYTEQPRYRFFDHEYVTGFYRNSPRDIDAREFFPERTSNQSMKPTAPWRSEFSMLATTPCRDLSLSR
jgi:hypothetical protein